MKRPKPGEKVILTCARPELFADLPVDNQKAICDIAGKPVLLKSYDSQGRAELQFTDSLGGIHFLHVEPTEIKAACDFISYVAYRRISLLLAVLFVFFAPLFLGFAWISDHWFKSDKPLPRVRWSLASRIRPFDHTSPACEMPMLRYATRCFGSVYV